MQKSSAVRSTYCVLTSVVVLVSGCARELSTATAPPAAKDLRPRFFQYSDGFYPSGDGYYWWDGNPPPGDAGSVIIQAAHAGGHAPSYRTAGWVSGEMESDADEWVINLEVTLSKNGHYLYNHGPFTNGWHYVLPEPHSEDRPMNYHNFEVGLNSSVLINPDSVLKRCDYNLEVLGSTSGVKAMPYALPLNLIKKLFPFVFGVAKWGDLTIPLDGFQEGGDSCDTPPDGACDLPNTPQFEPCVLDNDPAHKSNPYGEEHVTDVVLQYSGHTTPGGVEGGYRCVQWYDEFTSWDGRKSWYHTRHECIEYDNM